MRKPEIAVPRRIYHWINLVSIFSLIITGWYIHEPFAPGLMGMMKTIHFIFIWIFSITFVLRFYYAFFGKTGDWRTYLTPGFSKEKFVLALRHYFLYEPCPVGRQCDLIQNLAYALLVALFGVQIFTGFLLYYPENQSLASITYSMGGLAMLRKIHLSLMWIFITFIIVHLYMVLTEERQKAKLMMFGLSDEGPKVSELEVPVLADAKSKK